MNSKEKSAYDKTCSQIQERYGSHNNIAVRSYSFTNSVITGQTVRSWFLERKIPTDFAFTLYEMMDQDIDPLTLCPHLKKWVSLRED